MNHTSCKDTEIQFGRDDSPSETIVYAFADTGQVTITVQDTEVHGHACDNELSLGQAIHLRDFLNRHIDGLALAATGSLAVRSSDDPSQLASGELLEHRAMGGRVIGMVPAYSVGQRQEFVSGALATSLHEEPPRELDDPDDLWD